MAHVVPALEAPGDPRRAGHLDRVVLGLVRKGGLVVAAVVRLVEGADDRLVALRRGGWCRRASWLTFSGARSRAGAGGYHLPAGSVNRTPTRRRSRAAPPSRAAWSRRRCSRRRAAAGPRSSRRDGAARRSCGPKRSALLLVAGLRPAQGPPGQ